MADDDNKGKGGRYEVRDGQRKLVERTQERPPKTQPNPDETPSEAPLENDQE